MFLRGISPHGSGRREAGAAGFCAVFLGRIKRIVGTPVLPALVGFSLLFSSPLHPQTYPFQTYTGSQGFPRTSILSLFQDSRGYLWFGTWNGLYRFDGAELAAFEKQDGLGHNSVCSIGEDRRGRMWFGTVGGGVSCLEAGRWQTFTTRDGLASNHVQCIVQDRRGRLWFGHYEQGLSCLEDGRWSTITTAGPQGPPIKDVRSMLEDSRGNLWIGTAGEGVLRYDGSRWQVFTTADGLAGNHVMHLSEDRRGRIWFGTDAGSSYYDNGRWRSFTCRDGMVDCRVDCIIEDRDGNLWFGTRRGVTRYDGQGFRTFTREDGLARDHVRTMLQDAEGNLWFGTVGGGLSRLGPSPFLNYTKRDGLGDDMVITVLEDRQGNLWVGTYGGGLSRMTPNGRWTTFTERDGLASNYIRSLYEDSQGRLWYGTYQFGAGFFDGGGWKLAGPGNGMEYQDVVCIFEDRERRLWFGTSRGAFCLDQGRWSTLTTREGLAHNTVYSIRQDSAGALWFGTFGGGVSIREGDRWRHLTEQDGLLSDFVQVLFQARDGSLWIGGEGGVSHYTTDGRFVNYTAREGFVGNTCSAIVADDYYLYFASNLGVNRWDGESFKSFSSRDGLAGDELNKGSCFHDSRDRLWFATSTGLSCFEPERYRPNLIPPPVYINRVSGPEGQGYGPSSRLGHRRNDLTFDYSAVCFTSPGALVYHYRLQGHDPDWQTTRARSIRYASLPGGEYRFQVRAVNTDGVWSSAAAEFDFYIEPPFWESWWFLLCGGSLLVGLVFAGAGQWYRRHNRHHLQEKEEELTHIRLDNLERRRSEAALLEERGKLSLLLQHERLLSRIAARLNSAGSFGDILQELLEELGRTVSAEHLSFFELAGRPSGERRLARLACWCPGNGCRCPIELDPPAAGRLLERLRASGYAVLVEEPSTNGGRGLIGCEVGDRWGLVAPLALDGDLRGLFCCCRPGRLAWSENELELWRTVSHLILGAWERQLQFQALLEAEKNRAEAIQLAEQAGRLASIGELAAGITHEILQPLTTINFAVNRLIYWHKSNEGVLPEAFAGRLQKISFGVERIDHIIQHMRSFWDSPGQEPDRPTDLNQAVEAALSLIGRQLYAHGVNLQVSLSPAPLTVDSQSIRLEQVVINLTVNAMHSLDSRGGSQEKRLEISTFIEEGQAVLEMRDNGTGVPAEALPRIFDAFFTTKRPGEGTGLGLAIVRRFVEKCAGTIAVANNESGGAVFTVRLPIAAAVRPHSDRG